MASLPVTSEFVPGVQQTRWNGSQDHVQVNVGIFKWNLYIINSL